MYLFGLFSGHILFFFSVLLCVLCVSVVKFFFFDKGLFHEQVGKKICGFKKA
jgi:hypothetical protein